MSVAPRRILMTADAIGGVWSYALELSGELARRDVEVVLAVMGDAPSPAQRLEIAALPNVTLAEGPFKLEWMPDADDDVARAGEWLLDLAATHRPDMIHLNGFAHAALPFGVPVLVVAHSDVVTWWAACRGDVLPREWDRYRAHVRRAAASADLLVAPTRAYLDAFTRAHGEARRSRVILNGRDPRRYAPGEKRAVVLAAGRLWDKAKNIATLVEAARGLPFAVEIAGPIAAPEGRSVPESTEIEWLGTLPHAALAERMAQAAVFAAPARYEPFGLGVLEAALSGSALVLSETASFRELWEDAAIFVPHNDPAALRAALAHLLEAPEQAAVLGARARARGESYTAQRMGDGYSAAYHGLLGQDAARVRDAAGAQA